MAQVKTKEEIKKVKMACRITDAIFTYICHKSDLWQMTEIELRDLILSKIKKRGLRPSFPPIVTSGGRAGNSIHPKPTDQKLSGFVIVDFGVRYLGYCSDMTRMLYVVDSDRSRREVKQNKLNNKEKEIYKKILYAQNLGIKNSKIGAKCADVDDTVRKSLGNYKKYFIHTLGHGVGRKIHENPKLYYKHTKPVLKEGMVITIEPGIYIKNKLGIRIEDTILIQKGQPQILTKSFKKLIIIKN